ncbi:MAG: hypothetical protein ACOYMS_02130 [Terrimicrobiaceae bacterium]
MRISAPIFFLLAAGVCSQAQKKEEPPMNMIERMDAGRNRAMAALNSGNQGKKTKPDPLLESSFSSRSFQGGSDARSGKSANVSPFLYDQKYGAKKFESGRSFFGIKNPWFGNKVFTSSEADLWSKNLVANSDKKFSAGQAATKAFASEGKAAPVEAPVEAKGFIAQGSAQGSVSKVTDRIHKEMTVEEVRELLNKNR